jgi:hypothetical protein
MDATISKPAITCAAQNATLVSVMEPIMTGQK